MLFRPKFILFLLISICNYSNLSTPTHSPLGTEEYFCHRFVVSSIKFIPKIHKFDCHSHSRELPMVIDHDVVIRIAGSYLW